MALARRVGVGGRVKPGHGETIDQLAIAPMIPSQITHITTDVTMELTPCPVWPFEASMIPQITPISGTRKCGRPSRNEKALVPD
jgi:hypothetical protein